VEDTIILGEGTWENMWHSKTILRSFEMVTMLKSKLYGLNLADSSLDVGHSFFDLQQ